MENNKYLKQILENLPKGIITYTHKPNKFMNISYTLQARNYTELYLNNNRLEDLIPEEQFILLDANNSDPTYTPQTMLAGIFKARNIEQRSNDNLDAIEKCNDTLIKLNRMSLQKRADITETIYQHNVHANLLEHYLNVEKKYQEYENRQKTITAPVRNFVNGILEKITKKPYGKPPYTQDERNRANLEWKKFREEQQAEPTVSNQQLLKKYRYNSDLAVGNPFDFLYNNPELSALNEEYATTMISLKVLDGSAYQKAIRSLNRNPRKYLEHAKTWETISQK